MLYWRELEVVPVVSRVIDLTCCTSRCKLQPLFAVEIQSTLHSGGLVISHVPGVEC